MLAPVIDSLLHLAVRNIAWLSSCKRRITHHETRGFLQQMLLCATSAIANALERVTANMSVAISIISAENRSCVGIIHLIGHLSCLEINVI